MTNAELIAALRYCISDNADDCDLCPYQIDCKSNGTGKDKMIRDAADALEAAEQRIAELEAQMPKWTMLKDEMPKPHTNVLVSGIEAINNVRVYKVMVNDNGTLRPTDYAPSIMWDYWMPFESPNCGARMRKGERMNNSIELLEEWQERLFLNAWRIIIRPKCKPDEMPDCWGRTEWEEVNKTARIDIVDPNCLTDKMIPFDFEEVLVHELLHLKFCLLSDNSDENIESRYVHQLIDEMARAFVDAKRYCADGERRTDDETKENNESL